MKQKKLLLTMAAVFLLLAAFTALRTDREKKIGDFVRNNQTALEAIAAEHLTGNGLTRDYKTVQVDGVYGNTVQFYHSGAGIVTSATYYGFYFSADGLPAAYAGVELPLTALPEGGWTWTDGTDNGGVTRHITGNWYYFEAWF